MFQTSFLRAFTKQALTAVLLGAVFIPLSACDLSKNYLKADRSSDMEIQDYRDALAPRLPDIDNKQTEDDASIPALKQYMATPTDKMKPMPLVSISVNQSVPLKDVLYELAQQANYDIQLDPRITGSIIFTARNKPFDQVIDQISESANLRYKFDNDSVKVELDMPYHEIYKVNYLNYVRKNTSSISNDVSVVTGEGADTGSKFKAEATSDADFWGEVDTNLTQIMGIKANSLTTKKDPKITTVTDTPAPVEPVVLSSNGDIAQAGKTPDGTPAPAAATPAVLRVEPLADTDDGSATVDPNAEDPFVGRFSINRQAGIISVFATERTQKKVKTYLDTLEKAVTAQVLIEAKVLEVSLNDEFAAGIDWSSLNLFGHRFGFDIGRNVVTGGAIASAVPGAILPAFDPVTTPQTGFLANYTGNSGNLNAAIQALSRFGTVHSLASPRLTVLNNQSAVLSVAKNLVYFELKIQKTTSENGVTNTDVDSTIKNVPEGVLINVMPSIDLDNQTISMSVRPTVTRAVDFVDDPAVSFASGGAIASRVPVMNVQEFDSVIKMDNGQPIVLGGLIQDESTSTQTGVPVLGEVPVVGGLFRNQNDRVTKSELVVFLKATIVNGNSTINDTDRDIYKTFSQDRRPFDM